MPAHEIDQRGPDAFIRNVHDIDARGELQQLRGHVHRSAHASRAECQFARSRFCECDEILDGTHRQAGMNDERGRNAGYL
jgi:hypothetical protein